MAGVQSNLLLTPVTQSSYVIGRWYWLALAFNNDVIGNQSCCISLIPFIWLVLLDLAGISCVQLLSYLVVLTCIFVDYIG